MGPAARFSEGWQLIVNTGTTIVNFLVGFAILAAQSRSERAIQTKLDAILVALERVDDGALAGLEDETEEAIKARQQEVRGTSGWQPS